MPDKVFLNDKLVDIEQAHVSVTDSGLLYGAGLFETMRSHVCYFVAEKDGKIAAASSGEMDTENRNAEMTDFATRPEHRGTGLGSYLLERMEVEMDAIGMPTLYTIARSLSPGMNIVFSKMGYQYAGTLVNNTNISGQIENMNVWYKQRADRPGGG